MNQFDLLLKKTFHHAYLCVGEPVQVLAELKEALSKKFGAEYVKSGNPDFLNLSLSFFGIDDSRRLKSFQSRRAVRFSDKCIVIQSNTFTIEAQNALLKTLEEPAQNTHIFIISSQAGNVLPTVTSRCQLVNIESEQFSADLEIRVEKFLHSDITERNAVITEVLSSEDGVMNSILFTNCLLKKIWEKKEKSLEVVRISEKISEMSQLLNSRGGSPKLILEFLAAFVPSA